MKYHLYNGAKCAHFQEHILHIAKWFSPEFIAATLCKYVLYLWSFPYLITSVQWPECLVTQYLVCVVIDCLPSKVPHTECHRVVILTHSPRTDVNTCNEEHPQNTNITLHVMITVHS